MEGVRFIRVRGRIVPIRADRAATPKYPVGKTLGKAYAAAGVSGAAGSVVARLLAKTATRKFGIAAAGVAIGANFMQWHYAIKAGASSGKTKLGRFGHIAGNIFGTEVARNATLVATSVAANPLVMARMVRASNRVTGKWARGAQAYASKVKAARSARPVYRAGKVDTGFNFGFNMARHLNPRKALPPVKG